ncbi:MAG: PAS domain S-box protein [Nitriliruptoraceae bacterium]
MATHRGVAEAHADGGGGDALPERVAVLRQASLEVLYCNAANAADHGVTPGELVGRSLLEVLPAGEGSALATHLASLSRSQPEQRSIVEHRGRVIEWADQLLIGRDGDTVLSIGRDVTDQRSLAAAHREVDARFRVAMDEAPIGMALVSLDGAILEVNPALCRLVGRDEAELLTLTTLDITHPDDVPLDRTYGQQLLAGGADQATIEKRFVRPDGTIVWGLLKTSIVHDADGDPAYLVGQVVDITDRMERETALRQLAADERALVGRLRELDDLKHNFVSAVSHEMLTPLTALRGFAEVLRDRRHGIPIAEVDRITDRMCRNAERLGQLVDDLLDLRPLAEDGTTPRRLAEADLAATAGAIVDGFPVGNRSIVTDLVSVSVPLHTARIERVVASLLTNAARHTPEGTTIWVEVDRDADGARLTVADDGPGIADELKASLFDPFVKGPSPAAQAGGSGIGLTMVARSAALHGGRAWIADRDGSGTAVHVWLPSTGRA